MKLFLNHWMGVLGVYSMNITCTYFTIHYYSITTIPFISWQKYPTLRIEFLVTPRFKGRRWQPWLSSPLAPSYEHDTFTRAAEYGSRTSLNGDTVQKTGHNPPADSWSPGLILYGGNPRALPGNVRLGYVLSPFRSTKAWHCHNAFLCSRPFLGTWKSR